MAYLEVDCDAILQLKSLMKSKALEYVECGKI